MVDTDEIMDHLRSVKGEPGTPQYENIDKAIVLLGGGMKRGKPTKD